MTASIFATDPQFHHSPNEIFSETSYTYTRTDGFLCEMAVQHPSDLNDEPELILATGTRGQFDAEQATTITYSLQEILLLRDLLNRQEVLQLLGIVNKPIRQLQLVR